MKKILMIFCIFILTGCKNELVCTLNTVEESYDTEQKIIFNFENDKVNDVVVNYTMIFEDEEIASSYMNAFESLTKEYEINLSGNKIQIISEKNYDQYDQNKEELKAELEKNGYSCK